MGVPGRLRHLMEVLYLLVRKELRVRYKGNVIGYLWALANPIAFAAVYYFAFKTIMRVETPNYPVFLLTGLFPWVWLSNAVVQATSGYRGNVSLVKRVKLEPVVLPLSCVVQEMVHFCFALPVLVLLVMFTGGVAHVSWLWQVPLLLVSQLAILIPLGLVLALTNAFVRDVEYLVGIGVSLTFFLTPVAYPVELVPELYRGWFAWSPPAILVACWRSVLMDGSVELSALGRCAVAAAALSALACVAYRKMAYRLGELL